ncbi:MAG: hydrogenase expression/formation protein HypE [Eubacterium sp.]|nr:hydrogenase expression/formation protein HypE [Eubacterium sp.]
MAQDKITMLHGSGGQATGDLIKSVFAEAFSNEVLGQMEDSAVVPGSGTIAMTTDSFVVTPLMFPGGDIGRLAVCGTVNDLLMRGAKPMYLTCGFILEEGLEVEVLKQAVQSMAETAREAGVLIVAGDTKVIEGNGGMYINTAGVGFVENNVDISSAKIRPGDAILVSGTMGDHHAALLGERMEIETEIKSDNAPLSEMVAALLASGLDLHAMRDVTRGGLATVLKEMAESSQTTFVVQDEAIPVTPQVRDFCGLLGLDPYYMGNEGKLVLILPEDEAEKALKIIRGARYGEGATRIGKVYGKGAGGAEDVSGSCVEGVSDSKAGSAAWSSIGAPGDLIAETAIGGQRRMDVLQDEGLPRIC